MSRLPCMMKAIRLHKFGAPEVLQVENVAIPSVGAKDVLIRVKSSGINPADTYIRSGQYAFLPTLPATLGKEVSGIIELIGPEVKKYQKGDRVFATLLDKDGGYAEYAVCNEDNVFPLSKKLSFSQGAGVYISYITAYRALVTKCQAKCGETLLVHGASGAVGLAAVQLGKVLGMTVAGTAGSSDGIETVKKVGADFVGNHREKDYLGKITKSVGKFDIILENLSNVNLGHDLTILKQNARVAVVGCRGTVEINPRLLMLTESSVIGVLLMNASKAENQEAINAVLKGIESGWVCPIVSHEYKPEEVSQAHHDIINSTGAKGKSVFVF